MKIVFSLIIYLFFTQNINAQILTGIVTDANTQQPIKDANINWIENNYSTYSNLDGKFEIKNISIPTISLQISKIGYTTQNISIAINAQKEISIALEPSHFKLNEIIIAGTQSKLLSENLMPIERKNMQELLQNAPTSLAEAITVIPGVEQQSTGTGIGKPIIRGLAGNRIVTYAQDIRIENQQWGDEHGLGIGEVGIEDVEVIKGPASLLYGADALGGVLFFVDEKYTKPNNMEGFVQSTFQSNSIGSTNNAGIKIHKNNIKCNVFGSYTSNADYKTPNNDRVFNTRFNEKCFKTSLGYSNKKWITNLKYSYLENNFGITDYPTLYSNSKIRNMILPFQKIGNHFISWNNIFYIAKTKLNIVLGYTTNNRKEFTESIDTAGLFMKLNTFTYNTKLYIPTKNKNINCIVGSQGMYQTNKNFGKEALIPNATTKDVGIFSTINYNYKQLKLEGGIRLDNRNITSENKITNGVTIFNSLNKSYTSTNFSLGALYRFSKIDVRANVSKGFRTPNTSELLANGIHEGTYQYLIGNANLKSENAMQYDLAVNYTSEHINFSINPFFNNITNYIFLQPANYKKDSMPVYNYMQKNAVLYGGEAGVHFHPHNIHWLHLESNISTIFAQDNLGNPLPLIPATRINITIKAEFNNVKQIQLKSVFLNPLYKFSQNRIGLFETTSTAYTLFNAGANLDIKTKYNPIEVLLAIKNIFNTTYIDHLSRFKNMGIPNQGINFVIGAKYKF